MLITKFTSDLLKGLACMYWIIILATAFAGGIVLSVLFIIRWIVQGSFDSGELAYVLVIIPLLISVFVSFKNSIHIDIVWRRIYLILVLFVSTLIVSCKSQTCNDTELLNAYRGYYHSTERMLDSFHLDIDDPIFEGDYGVEYLHSKYTLDSLLNKHEKCRKSSK